MKNKFNLDELLGKPTLSSEKFHEQTKLKKAQIEPDAKRWPESWKTVYFKSYPRFNEVLLPKPRLNSGISFKETLFARSSTRKFSARPLSIADIGSFLYYGAGLKDTLSPDEGRFYPSAGARYPLEIYVLSINSELPSGLYHYYLKNHSLEELMLIKKPDMFRYIAHQKWIKNVSCLIFTTAIFSRTTMKYGPRGYRHILTENGAVLQNFYLVATALGIRCCPVASFLDNKINELLDIDGIEESVINALLIGYP